MTEWETPQYQPGQRIKLTDLSNDILVVLAECISEQKFASTQYLLSHCSRHLKQLAKPYLSLSYTEETTWPLSKNTSLQEFLRTILGDPGYAKRFKKYQGDAISFPSEDSGAGSEGLNVSMFTELDWIRIRAAIKELEPDGVKTSLWNIERGSWEAITTLVLSHLPYLEKLEFQGWPNDDGVPSLTTFISNTAEHQKIVRGTLLPHSVPLAHLTKVSLSYHDTEMGMGLGELDMFMELKSVEHITGHMIAGEFLDENGDPDEDEDEGWDVESSGSRNSTAEHPNITGISFTWSAIDYRELDQFLLDFPNLQRFSYVHGGAIVGDALFLPPRFMRALKRVRNSLEELTIDDQEGGSGVSITEFYPLGSFAGFPKLKILNLVSGLLLGSVTPDQEQGGYDDEHEITFPTSFTLVTALPPNLEKLTMSCDTKAMPALFELLENIHSFSSLKLLHIGWSLKYYPDKPSSRELRTHPGFTLEEAIKFRDLCDTAGVSIVYSSH